MTGAASPRLAAGVAALLAAATLLVWWPVLGNDFVEYDDAEFITANPQVAQGLNPRTVLWALTSTEHSNWFPLTRLSWLLDATLFGLDPAAFHGSSLLLHALTAALLFAALWRLTGALWPSAWVAACFALHPLRVESVAWAAERKDILSGLFFALALLAHERRARAGPRWGPAVAAALALGLMAKPMLVTLPAVLLLLDVWPLGRWRPGAPRAVLAALVREKALLFALVGASCALTLYAQAQGGSVKSLEGFGLGARALNALVSYFDYVLRFLWPVDLAVLYPMSRNIGINRLVVGVLALAIATTFALRQLERRPWAFTGWFWFAGMLVPVIGLVQVGAQASADRYTYLPAIGLALCAVWGARDLVAALPAAARRSATGALALLGLAALVALSVQTRQQIATWRDTTTLYTHAVTVTPGEPHMLRWLGDLHLRKGRPDEAVAVLERALRAEPGSAQAHLLLARALVRTGRPDDAARHRERARALAADGAPGP